MELHAAAGFGDRARFLEHVRSRRPTVGKRAFVLDRCRDRSVLDIGCVDHDAAQAFDRRRRWLHGEISAVASSATGLDFLAEDVARLVAAGYDVVAGEAESFRLERTFDVVVAADVIEHLADLGAFLQRVAAHVHADSLLVMTTPNPIALARFVQALVRNRIAVNEEHTIWLDPSVMHELLRRHGFVPVDFAWLHDDDATGSVASKVLDALSAPLLRYRPLLRRSFGIAARRA